MRCVFLALLAALTLVHTGCGFFADREETLDGYVEELAEAVGEPVDLSPIPTVQNLPRRRERILEVAEIDMGVVDFLSLYGCDLQVVVGERTSIMGRVMDAGKRLDYEIRFLGAAEDCLPDMDSERRRNAVKEAVEMKTEKLPNTLWNSIWAAEEMERLTSRSRGTLPSEGLNDEFSQLAADLVAMNTLIANYEPGEVPQQFERLGGIYERWQKQALVGQLLRSAEAIQTRLNDAAGVMETVTEESTICDERALWELYEVSFLETVEPRLSQVQTHRRSVIPLLYELTRSPGAEVPEGMAPFIERNLEYRNSGSVWQDLDEAVARHGEAWSQAFSACS